METSPGFEAGSLTEAGQEISWVQGEECKVSSDYSLLLRQNVCAVAVLVSWKSDRFLEHTKSAVVVGHPIWTRLKSQGRWNV